MIVPSPHAHTETKSAIAIDSVKMNQRFRGLRQIYRVIYKELIDFMKLCFIKKKVLQNSNQVANDN